ncbi:MAG: peptide-methionine (S)-S-oxide reductase MsrA [Bdellovibrionaceae bacterium]|nr:peptide-methionine (S)-S-oxide reductase MsrA [Pseudobdellovibrionaceae bacterium]
MDQRRRDDRNHAPQRAHAHEEPNTKLKGTMETSFPEAQENGLEVATLAGGCFWGVEELLRLQKGVLDTFVGYIGGDLEKPVYTTVKTGTTGHAEAVQILFDPKQTTFENILLFFFQMHDPTTVNRQGNDIGTQYRSAIFYHDSKQQEVAKAVIGKVDKSGAWKKPVVTEVVPYTHFWKAEEYHQEYLVKNPDGYTCHFIRDVKF